MAEYSAHTEGDNVVVMLVRDDGVGVTVRLGQEDARKFIALLQDSTIKILDNHIASLKDRLAKRGVS